jgi:rhodanese-related sulfurtransferase
MSPNEPPLPSVKPARAAQRDDGAVLVDVREPDEWSAGHAPGAHHRPLSDLDPASIPDATTVYCICRSGGRSAHATARLRQAGHDARNVEGGMHAWERAGLPVIRDDERPGAVV